MTSAFLQSQLDAHAARGATLAGAGIRWLAQARARNLAGVEATGLPTARNERWKYTPLKSLEARAVLLADADTEAAQIDRTQFDWPGIDGPRVVFVDGAFRPGLSRMEGIEPGVELGSIADALARGGDGLDGPLSRHYDDAAQGFARLNGALADDGAFIRVAAGTQVARPLQLVFLGGAGDAGVAWYARNVIQIERGATLRAVVHFAGTGASGCVGNVVNQIMLHGGASLDWVRVQDCDDASILIERTDARVGAQAALHHWSFDLGAALARHDLAVHLLAEGAAVQSRGVFVPRGRQHHENALDLVHGARDTRCDVRWRGIADARGRGVFGGRIVVEAGADGADAQLENKNLLLSPHAEIDTRPVLEIHADEVKASHGATVGQLDERALFYLRSRGVPLEQARAMLTYAFCREILDTTPVPGLREPLADRLRAHLPQQAEQSS